MEAQGISRRREDPCLKCPSYQEGYHEGYLEGDYRRDCRISVCAKKEVQIALIKRDKELAFWGDEICSEHRRENKEYGRLDDGIRARRNCHVCWDNYKKETFGKCIDS